MAFHPTPRAVLQSFSAVFPLPGRLPPQGGAPPRTPSPPPNHTPAGFLLPIKKKLAAACLLSQIIFVLLHRVPPHHPFFPFSLTSPYRRASPDLPTRPFRIASRLVFFRHAPPSSGHIPHWRPHEDALTSFCSGFPPGKSFVTGIAIFCYRLCHCMSRSLPPRHGSPETHHRRPP